MFKVKILLWCPKLYSICFAYLKVLEYVKNVSVAGKK